MTKISQLGERLKAQIEQDQRLIESQTSDALRRHEESLRQLSSGALSTTKNAIKSHRRMIERDLEKTQREMQEQSKQLLKRLAMLMLFPLAATAAACLLMIALTWLYLPAALFSAQTETWTFPGGQRATVIISPGWTTCAAADGRQYPCKLEP